MLFHARRFITKSRARESCHCRLRGSVIDNRDFQRIIRASIRRKVQLSSEESELEVMSTSTTNIESVLHEERIFAAPPEFSEKAHIGSMRELEELREEAER